MNRIIRNNIICEINSNQFFSYSFFLLSIIFSWFHAFSINAQQTTPYPISFISEGSQIQGVFYLADIKEPTPTVILLHGGIGNEKAPLGLGAKLIQEGINALAFNYRGSWSSEGLYTPENALQDVNSAVSYLLSTDIINKFSIDTTNLFIAGYSYGGSMALIGSLNNPSIKGIISIAGFDLSVAAREMEKNEVYKGQFGYWMQSWMSDSTKIRGPGAKAIVEWMVSTLAIELDLVKHAEELSEKDILLIGGWQDNLATIEGHILPFYRALQKNRAKNVEIKVFDDSHVFGNTKDALAKEIILWLKKKS